MVRTMAVFSNAGLAEEKEGSRELTRSRESVRQRRNIVSCGGCDEERRVGGCDI